MVNEQPRVVTRVTTAAGTNINVRNDELEKYLADNPGARVTNAPTEETEGEAAPPRATRARGRG